MQVTTNQISLSKCRLRLARPLRKGEATAIRGFFGRKFDDEIFMHNHEPDGTPVYHTYLGSAYCLTFPQWVEITRGESPDIEDSKLDCASIVPTDAIKQLLFDDGLHYSRAQRYALGTHWPASFSWNCKRDLRSKRKTNCVCTHQTN